MWDRLPSTGGPFGGWTVRRVSVESLAPNWSVACQVMKKAPVVPATPEIAALGLIAVGVFVVKVRSGGNPVAVMVTMAFGSPLPAVARIWMVSPVVAVMLPGALMRSALTATARAAGWADRETSAPRAGWGAR